MRYFLLYLIAINIITLIVYAADKFKAKHDTWRIPEKQLILLAVIGGSIGALGGMFLFRHKTLHKKFTIGIPLILAAQIAVFIMIMAK